MAVTPTSYIVNGQWGQWSVWTCSKPCGFGKIIRTRLCDSPIPSLGGLNCQPPKDNIQSSPDDCRLSICPEDCWPGTWGVNCKFRCNQCKSDCNKLNGRCDTCEPGYYNPSYGPFNCSTECPAMTYGFECRGSCYSKCSKECLDKQLGTCSTLTGVPFLVATYHYYFLVLLIIPVMTVVSELIRLKTSGSVDDGEDVQDYWGYPFYRRASETTRKFYPDDHLDDFRDDDDDLDDFDIDDLDLYGEDYLDEVDDVKVDPQVVPMEEPTNRFSFKIF
ncbi:platelet endothelial aggregation receptor 1-like isoform X1 [Biomphalaria glabrata]|uniref:Platelet endothelial aggregation receptor 1-like isoform X1 n=2 Tax=Biomphalaria glabrata TaxID=6526 RepID=A0A9W2ZDY9_BIOGL|nr:platelet endothelial aggregation receptor 1-like isoform X1 [Biomphalaria glabrata]